MANVTSNTSCKEACNFGPTYISVVSLIDIITVLMGQPVITRLLWITFTSKKATDILNCNLALFHNLQYLVTIMHLIALFSLPAVQLKILKFLFVYAQMGGPMSLSFICIERYVAVIHPTFYPLLKRYRFREVCVVVVWLFSVPFALIGLFGGGAFSVFKEHVIERLPFTWSLIMVLMMTQCTVSIARTLKKSGPGGDKMHPVKRRAFKTVCATSTIVVIFYSPVTIMQRHHYESEYVYDCLVTPVCVLLLSSASVVHPLFYLSAQRKLFTCFK